MGRTLNNASKAAADGASQGRRSSYQARELLQGKRQRPAATIQDKTGNSGN
jgi:hypothetical protein